MSDQQNTEIDALRAEIEIGAPICMATCGNNDGSYTDCTLPASHRHVIPSIPHSFEMKIDQHTPPASGVSDA